MNGHLTFGVRTTDPDTSRDAAILALETAETLRGRCLQALRAAGEHGVVEVRRDDARALGGQVRQPLRKVSSTASASER